jgi:hypothetical protein
MLRRVSSVYDDELRARISTHLAGFERRAHA